VATPAPSHVPIARTALEAGFQGALLIEKPVSNSVAAAEQLLELARTTGVRLGVDFHRRSSELFGGIARRVRSNEFGALRGIEFSRACKLSMNGAHFVDLANWFMASRPVSVSASLAEHSALDHRGTYYFDPPGTVEVTYANGLVFRLDALGKPEPGGRTGMTVRLERAELWVDADESVLEIRAGGSVERIPSDRGAQALNWVETTLLALLEPSTGYSPCSLPEAVEALSVIVAAHLSHTRGNRPIELPLADDDKRTALRVA
jgi:predicted dehydrogenase